jgi:hypothetical protein
MEGNFYGLATGDETLCQAVAGPPNLTRFTGKLPADELSGSYPLRIDFHVVIVVSEAVLKLPPPTPKA